MDLQDTIRTYRLFSGSYDVVFGPVFHLGRKDAVRIANALPGQRILEVGVGTGLSLPFFRSDSEVTGIDVSAEMLAKARHRVERQNLKHVKELSVMDAEKMDFPDNSFDAVMGMYVASVVPDPARFAVVLATCRVGDRRSGASRCAPAHITIPPSTVNTCPVM